MVASAAGVETSTRLPARSLSMPSTTTRSPDKAGGCEGRKKTEDMTPAEREAFKKRLESMTPEQREAFKKRREAQKAQ